VREAPIRAMGHTPDPDVPLDASDMQRALAVIALGYQRVGPGECVVPREPTGGQQDAGWEAVPMPEGGDVDMRAIYRAMLAAAELRALARRVCEEQPSGELNGEVWRLTDPDLWENLAECETPDFTGSLDAAASLMPEGWHWEVRDDGVARSTRPENNPSRCIAQHPAAALCAAALLARAADMEASDARP
jgi:hypothetical protein